MRLLVLLVISFISIESRSNNGDNESSGGQSDPPKFENTFESHESYRATIRANHEKPNLEEYKSSAVNNLETFKEAISSENVEYFESDKANDKKGNHEKLLELNNLESSEEIESPDISNGSSFVPCELGSSRVSSYIKLGTKVIGEDFNYSRDDENSSDNARTNIVLDVTHDVFETSSSGLLQGFIYKIELTQPQSLDVIDFLIESRAHTGEKVGEFFEDDQEDQRKALNLIDNLNKKNLKSSKNLNSSNIFSHNVIEDQIVNANACELNTFYHKFNESKREPKLSINWTLGNMRSGNFHIAEGAENFITFRLLYRRRSRLEIFQKSVTFNLLRECSLLVKHQINWFSSSLVPEHVKNCTFRFAAPSNQFNGLSQGLLIKILRLNVPCSSGGYLKFNGTITMCGKLEEFPESRRTLYFPSFTNASFSVNNNPKFKFIFKFVDNCYNVTFLERNGSFVIEPSDSPLKCHFKIHLPFGNRIRLKFRLNGDGETVDDSYKAIKKNVDEKFSYSDLKIDDFSSSTSDVSSSLPSGPSYCNGILIEIVNRLNEKWDQCASLSSGNSGYTLTSSDNVLLIRFTKQATSFPQSSKQHKLSLEYSVEPIETIVSQCAFGWILAGQFCLSTFNELLTWQEAENFCNTLSGHLASIQNENEQQLIDAMLLNSPYFNDKMSFWIGASDKHFEGDFRWTDGLPFSYLNWFPGWKNHQNYNKQPNDDGFSNQDCVEIRRNYNQPSSSSSFLTESFMWNDRDCFTKNSFICERSVVDQPVNNYEKDDCNQTIYLSQEKTKLILTSPGFPRSYSENMNCVTFVVAPIGFRVLIEFEEFVLEHEPQCLYDYLEIFEPTTTQIQARNVTARHFHGSLRKNKKTLKHDMNNNDISFDHSNSGSQKSTKLILQPSNVTYNVFAPAPSLNNQVPRRMCGDWSSKLKLLRYRTKGNLIGIRFSSDYSYHFSGFKARVLLERDNLELRAASECIDEHLKLFNDSCYLVVSFPEVEWVVAQKICHSMGAQLSSVSTLEEQRFIISTIKANQDYNPSTLYWLGAEYKRSGQFMEWTDGTKVTYSGWFMGEEKVSSSIADDVCLALQWKVSSSSMIPSNFFWTYQKCTYTGGYVCKKSRSDNVLIQNQTITGIEGRMTSPNYPNPYSPNLNYWTKIIVPEKFRIVVQFQKLDIEQQHECLYDYVSIQDMKFYNDFETNLNDKSVLKREDELLDYRNEDDEMLYGDERKIHLLNKRSKVESKSSSLTETSPSFQPYIRLCGLHEGDMSKFDFVSTSNEIYFNFFTDHSISGEGFSAMWRSIDISACPGQTFTSREGTLTSPNFPHFLLHNLNCTFTVQAPKGRKIWIEFNDFDIIHDAEVLLDFGEDNLLKPFTDAKNIADGVFLSRNDKVKVVLRTGSNPRGKGFKLSFRTMFQNVESRILRLTNATVGNLFHLNHPHTMPPSINFTQHLSVPLGNVFSVELHGMKFGEQTCDDGSSVEVIDKYADNNGTYWLLCRANKQGEQQKAAIFITSYLNTIHIRQRSSTNSQLGLLNATIRVQPDINYKLKLLSTSDEWVESCQPNPCNNEGKCIVAGKRQMCQCKGHFTGRFCGLNMCELDPCVFGTCELTNSSFKCICQTGYLGLTCDQRQKPCSENPCEGRGECIEKNGGYTCRCFAWFEGLKCEKRMRIPYRPLSERMLQEPFWLGLITVFVVLAVIGLVWCAKRHFPEKIEKLLQEEADRNRPAHLRHHHHISLREQLQVAGAANNSLMQSGSTQAIVTTPGTQKSIFGRLGIRKPSLLSLSSPQPPQGGSTARTFSLDDLLMPLPRRSPSPRKKRNNSTPTRKNAAEKKKILQQLISPNTNNKVTLGELIQLSETEDARNVASGSSENHFKETAFIERPSSSSTIEQPQRKLTRQVSSDPKLEKKVTFARLLSKMSAEINHGTDIDGNNHSSALSLPTDVQLRANSVPQSPCTNDIRSPHSTSSNQGSDSLSSSELALHEFSLKNNIRKNRPKVSSADSILAMFRNFASSNVGLNLPASLIFSPSSSTPTASSPQDDMGDDESSTSSIATPVSFSSGAPDSPVFYRQSTIEVPVMDALSAHKTTPAQNLLHPPTILLEIPGNITKCLSPIKEMPTPMPSPALTPIMPRPQRIAKSSHVRDFAFSDDDDKNQHYLSKNPNFVSDTCNEMRVRDSDNESITIYTTSSENSACSMRKSKFMTVPTISIDIDPPTPEERRDKRSPQRPKDLIIPELVVQTPSPTKERYPVVIIPGSPPPQRERASLGETSGLFPNKQQQKRLLMQFEKPGSLDFPFVPPMITITANMSEVESDNEFMSPAVTSKASLMPNKLMPNSSGMTYLSPFSMCTRGDRAPSEGNLSSSGYSSMASPGPSRCGSNSKLCASEMDSTNLTPSTSNPRRFQSILKKPDDKDRNKDEDGSECFRKRSDSETLSDETLLESNDEGIGTDHIDEKIEDGDIKSARDLEVFIGKELLETGKSLMRIDEPVMSQLQLPSIVIQSELGFDKLSPVSSRSESPLSDRNIGMARFSPQFYGKKDQQLPFTDSDGLYDFPSSDGKGGSTASVFLRKSNGKRRERRSTKSTNLSASPTKSSVSNEKICVQLEIPSQSTSHQSTSKHQQSSSLVRKSPKRRLYRYTPSSSSSTESLTAGNGGKEMPSTKLRDRLIESIEMKHNQTESERCGQKPDQQKRNVIGSVPGGKKVSRMKAISNQIRFLRRLEQALKERGKSKYIGDVDDDSDLESTSVTSPLLGSSSKDSEQKSTSSRFTRQKRIVHPSENSAIVDNISD